MRDLPINSSVSDSLRPVDARGLRVVIFQGRLPAYRRAFFEALGRRCGGLTVLHGPHTAQEGYGPPSPGAHFAAQVVTLRTMGPAWWMPALLREIDPARYDVAIFTWNPRYVHLVPGLLRARRRGVGSVLWGHGYSKREIAWRRGLTYRIGRAADVVLPYSRRIAQELVGAGFATHRVVVASNAIDQDRIQTARQAWLDRPDELLAYQRGRGLEGRPVALYVSRLVNLSDLDILFDAWQAVVRQLPEARLLIVGDGAARAAMEDYCRRLGLDRAVQFLGAVFDEQQLAPLFLTARVFAYPRRIGLSLHHAFGYGLPCVVFDNPAHHGPEFEALVSEVNGVAVKEDDRDALTQALLRLLTNPGLAARLGQAARETVLREYTIERMADNFAHAIGRARELAVARRDAKNQGSHAG